MRSISTSWKQLFFYGEIFGFLLAWIVGIAMTLQTEPQESHLQGVDRLASTTDLNSSSLE